MTRGVTEASATESLIERLKAHSCGCGGPCGQQTPAYIAEAAAELEALRSRCEEARQIIEGFAPLCEEGSRALRFLAAARALQQGGKAE